MLKKCTYLVLAIICFSTALTAQSSNSYKLGTRTVIISPPKDFVDVVPRFERIAARFIATESPGNEVLAVHVPETYVSRLEKLEEPAFDFYTKVSVSKRLKEIDCTRANFSDAVSQVRKSFDSYLNPKGQFLLSIVKNANKGLTEHLGQDPELKIGETKNLGYFDSQPDIFSAMILMKVEAFGKPISLLGTLSLIRVNNRMIYVYAYRKLETENDAEILRDFTKKWTSEIMESNK
jgi:hypothetical protein